VQRVSESCVRRRGRPLDTARDEAILAATIELLGERGFDDFTVKDLVKVMAAGIIPGEASIRKGLLDAIWPTTVPSGQGSDLAGIVAEVGPDVTKFAVDDEVLGFVDTRSSQAELVVADVGNLVARSEKVQWDAAGALFVVGTTAYAAVRAVNLVPGDMVVVSGAAGGVGSLAVQLATGTGPTVLGLASEGHHGWLASHGVTPVAYGDGVVERIRGNEQGPH
jgi:NADPH:quinone reductase-like Zn-dependent oxidoreductase